MTISAKEVWGKVMFLHLCAILFTGAGWGGWLHSMHHRSHDRGFCIQEGSIYGGMVRIQGSLHEGGVCIGVGGCADPLPWYTVNKRVVRILLECILV